MENSETSVWIDFAFDCKYIDSDTKNILLSKNDEIGRLLHHMINNPEKCQTSEIKLSKTN